mmetsp:Transcript_24577/g.41886  ORF Transcript_24577/g.41886 Transcript_24577/m.41886 type:complete len:250 (-) Transcript_24577:705-1454(-)
MDGNCTCGILDCDWTMGSHNIRRSCHHRLGMNWEPFSPILNIGVGVPTRWTTWGLNRNDGNVLRLSPRSTDHLLNHLHSRGELLLITIRRCGSTHVINCRLACIRLRNRTVNHSHVMLLRVHLRGLLIINILLRLISCLIVHLIGLLNILIHLIGKQWWPTIDIAAKVIRWLITRNRNIRCCRVLVLNTLLLQTGATPIGLDRVILQPDLTLICKRVAARLPFFTNEKIVGFITIRGWCVSPLTNFCHH